MKSRSLWRVCFGVALLAATGALSQPCLVAAGTECVPFVAGHDTTYINYSGTVILGKALGQSFVAPETRITKLTVWRPPGNLSLIGAHLFFTEVDSTVYDPPLPRTSRILFDGPTVVIQDSDPPGGLIEMQFVIDPPFTLPHPGQYAFFLQAQNCWQGSPWYVCKDTLDRYPGGEEWVTGRALAGECFLPGTLVPPIRGDLIFEIEYCDAATPTRRKTWGELKLLYR